ncbi:hypothetical protein [Sporosarcina sp. FSL W7-1283]|uniref:hypothetical protein n=1 Tax=Sporosarcina sp. FSL W7-1283 TaxID=2921560 RepID=UPI0030F60AB1
MLIQIIGQNLDVAFKELSIKASKVYESKENEFGSKYQVWELAEIEYEKLQLTEDYDWKDGYGWWRNGGCNHSKDGTFEFNVNENKMIGFKNEFHYYHSEEYLSELEEEGEEIPSYSTFSEWFNEYMSLSKEVNLAYFAHSLADINGLTKAEFFQKFEG